jgi:uncharacterized protein YjbI with pentapeptide repeats
MEVLSVADRTFEPSKYLSSLIQAINDAAKAAQTWLLAFTGIGLYLIAMSISASDEDLFLGHTVAISQLGVQLPAVVSFTLGPIIFLLLHAYTLIRFDMLSANLRQFQTELAAQHLSESNQERCRQLLANVEFVQMLVVPRGSPLNSRLFPLVSWILIGAFPVVVLLILAISAIRFQSEAVRWAQFTCLVADLCFLSWFTSRLWSTSNQAPFIRLRQIVRIPAIAFIVGALDLLWLGVPTGSDTDVRTTEYLPKWHTRDFVSAAMLPTIKQPLDRLLCPALHFGCRYLDVSKRSLFATVVWNKSAVAQLRSGNYSVDAKWGIEGPVLVKRNLRFANLDEAELFGADLRGSDLTRASLTDARIQGADFSGATLTEADLSFAHLQGSKFEHASAPGIKIAHADLRACSFKGADLAGADFSMADAEAANFQFATLLGVDMSLTDLRVATLDHSDLMGSDFTSARVWRTSWDEADIELADLSDLHFEPSLSKAEGAKVLDSVPDDELLAERQFIENDATATGPLDSTSKSALEIVIDPDRGISVPMRPESVSIDFPVAVGNEHDRVDLVARTSRRVFAVTDYSEYWADLLSLLKLGLGNRDDRRHVTKAILNRCIEYMTLSSSDVSRLRQLACEVVSNAKKLDVGAEEAKRLKEAAACGA